MPTLLMARAAACAVAVAMAASACGGFTAVDDNQEEVCAQLAKLDGPLGVMFPETNPEGNVAQARFGAAAYLVVADESTAVLNSSQETLLARVTSASEQYAQVLATRPDDALLRDHEAAFDAAQMNIVANHRIMLEHIGCVEPDFLAQFPDT